MNQEYGVRDRLAVDVSLLVVRVIAGVIMAAHGAQKLFGVFGGAEMEMMDKMIAFVGPAQAYAVAIGEFFGGVGLILGFLSRFSAAANIVIMLGAIVMAHSGSFFLPQGFEYNLALIGLFTPTLLAGPGAISIGRFLPLPKARYSDRPILVLE